MTPALCHCVSPPHTNTHTHYTNRYDTREAGTLYNALVGNPLVAATSSGFQYASKHGIDSKAALLGYIRRHPLGARSIDFKDSYE